MLGHGFHDSLLLVSVMNYLLLFLNLKELFHAGLTDGGQGRKECSHVSKNLKNKLSHTISFCVE